MAEVAGDLAEATQAAIRRETPSTPAGPLRRWPADDAVVLDTTGLSVDGVVAEVLARYRAALEAAERT